MRVLHLVHSLEAATGGVARAVLWLGSCAARDGQSPVIATAHVDADFRAPEGCEVRVFPPESRIDARTGSAELRRWFRDEAASFDLIVAHGLWQFPTALCAKSPARPHMVVPHGMLDPWFRRSGPAKHVLKQALWLIREGRVVNGAARLVFTAQEEAARAHGVFQPWNPKVAVCPLAVAEPPESDGEPLPDGLGQMPYLLFLARLHPKKGADLLLEAWARLGGRTQGRALVIAGPAEDPAHAAQLHVLAAAAMRSGAGPVLFTGMVTGVAKWALLRRAEAFVLPSHQENFGIAVAEALACGVPVLTTREVALWREIVADGAGFAESDDTDGVVRLLERHLISDAAALAKRRKDARACFTNRFTEAAAWAAWRTLFQEAAG